MSAEFDPQILAFCCKYCAYAAGDLAGSMRLSYPPNVKVVQVPCSGRVDITHLLAAEMPYYFAAAAPLSGTVGGHKNGLAPLQVIDPAAPLPLFLAHGTADPTVLF